MSAAVTEKPETRDYDACRLELISEILQLSAMGASTLDGGEIGAFVDKYSFVLGRIRTRTNEIASDWDSGCEPLWLMKCQYFTAQASRLLETIKSSRAEMKLARADFEMLLEMEMQRGNRDA